MDSINKAQKDAPKASFFVFKKAALAAFLRKFRCASCLAAQRASATLHRRGITIPAPFQARQSCRFLENGLLFPSQTALHRFPLRAKCFLPEGELPRSGQEKPLWRAHMSRQKTDLNRFRAVRGTKLCGAFYLFFSSMSTYSASSASERLPMRWMRPQATASSP